MPNIVYNLSKPFFPSPASKAKLGKEEPIFIIPIDTPKHLQDNIQKYLQQ